MHRRALPLLLIAAALTLLATFYFLGDLGRWTDDWAGILRDPVTGASDLLHARLFTPYFHRPLLSLTIYTIQTLLADHVPLQHALNIPVHAAVGALLYLLLRRLNLSTKSAAAATILFLVYPAHWEVTLWATAITTGIAAACALLTLLLALRFI